MDEREGEDATKWQEEEDIVEDDDPLELQNVPGEWDYSMGEDITIEDEDDVESSHHTQSLTIASTDLSSHHRESWGVSPDAAYKYLSESEHPEYSMFPVCAWEMHMV